MHPETDCSGHISQVLGSHVTPDATTATNRAIKTMIISTTSTPSTGDAHRSFCDVLGDGGGSDAAAATTGVPAAGAPTGGGVAGATFAVMSAPTSRSSRPRGVTRIRGTSFDAAAASIRAGLVGRHALFRTPFGARMPVVYADWTATGRAVSQIERYLSDEVLPLFGNTHTTTSITGAQTTCFRHEARQIIAQAVNAKV